MTTHRQSEHDRSPSQRGGIKKPLIIGLLFLIPPLCLAVSWLVLDSFGRTELVQAIAEADAQDPDWRMADLETRGRRSVGDAENGALVLLAADQLMPATWPAWPVLEAKDDASYANEIREAIETSMSELPPPVQLNDRQATSLRAELERASPALSKALQLADLPNGRYPITWSPDFISTLLPHVQKSRQITTLLGYDALLRAHDGDLNGALRACRAALNAGRSLGDEQMLISQLVRIACRSHAVHRIERVLAQGQASELALAALQQALAEEAEEPLMFFGLRGERAGSDSFLELLQNRRISISQLRGLAGTNAFGGQTLENLKLLFMMVSVKTQRAGMLQYMNEAVAAAKLPLDQQRQRLAELEQTMSRRASIVRILGPAVSMVAMSCDRSYAATRTAAVALAVERYRLANQHWPDSLESLLPNYLDEVPRDPFDGLPLRFIRIDEGVVIYSVGPDGVDNHGNITTTPVTPGTDIGFRLWNPDQRRQPPKPFQLPPRPEMAVPEPEEKDVK